MIPCEASRNLAFLAGLLVGMLYGAILTWAGAAIRRKGETVTTSDERERAVSDRAALEAARELLQRFQDHRDFVKIMSDSRMDDVDKTGRAMGTEKWAEEIAGEAAGRGKGEQVSEHRWWLLILKRWGFHFIKAAPPCNKGEILVGPFLLGWRNDT